VVGFGNPDAADDAVGILAVREARAALESISGVRVIEGSVGSDLTELLSEADAAIIVDAVRTSGAVVHPAPRSRRGGPRGLPQVGVPLSSHGFGASEAVALAAALGPYLRSCSWASKRPTFAWVTR
jgi:hydrogenase maturation protease